MVSDLQYILTAKQRTKLIDNWGDKASCMACLAEVKLFDPLSSWQCYIYALNPDNEDDVMCIIKGYFVEDTTWSLSEIAGCYNAHGQAVQIDREYRPREASKIYKNLKLQERYGTR